MAKLLSSKHHRNAERTNATAEIAGSALKSITPSAAIPAKIAQGFTSTYCVFNKLLKPHERVMHGFRATLAFAETGLLIAMLFKDEQCQTIKPQMCKALLMLELVYQGLLLVSWVPSEFFKSPNMDGTDSPDASEPASPIAGSPRPSSHQGQ